MRQQDTSGFTLLEVLIASLLIMGILMTTASITVRGVEVYRHWINARMEAHLALFWKELEGDIRNAAPSRLYPFAGEESSLSFGRRILLPVEGSGSEAALIGVEYRFDEDRHLLTRRVRRPAGVLYPERVEERVILEQVESFKWEYEDLREGFPAELRLTFELKENAALHRRSRSFWVPSVYYHGSVSR